MNPIPLPPSPSVFPEIYFLERGWSPVILWPLMLFSKNIFSRKRVKPCNFVTFNVIISHIFLENFIETYQVDQKIWKIMKIWHFLVTKKLIVSAFNRDVNHFFIFNRFYIGCYTILLSYINIGLVLPQPY